MKDKTGKVIYVGKAKNIKKRLASYFAKQDKSPKTAALVERVHKIETIAVINELEAFLLENELIKKYQPQFNIVMRDDKSYLYIRITVNEEFPRILLARRVTKDGAKYFGPYASSGTVYEVLKLIKRTFPLCSATSLVTKEGLKKKKIRACLNYHLKICPGVCVGKVKPQKYRQTIEQVIQFLRGNYPLVIQKLKKQMAELSEKKEFERAARIRDGLNAIEAINERQSVVRTDRSVNEDAIGIARQLNKALVVLLQVRSGALLNQQQYAIDTKYEADSTEILTSFLRDYYDEAADFPKQILLSEPIEDAKAFTRWLTGKAGHKISINVPAKGRQRALVRLAQSNAEMKFQQTAGRWRLEKLVATEGVEGLKQLLKLKKLDRIEAYDISNLQGTDSVGAMVVWEKGQLDKKQYRRFKIKTVAGPDDFASLAEVLRRRFAHLSSSVIPVSRPWARGQMAKAGVQTKKTDKNISSLAGQAAPRDTDADGFANLPDVVLIDGGKGQVGTVVKVLKNYKVAVIGIAKGSHSRTKAKDDLVLPSGKIEILPSNSPTKILLQNIRDEVHRFAIAYHTNLRKKRTITSAMEKIPGVGPAIRKKLIRKFGSWAAVRKASESEIIGVVGKKLAQRIKS